MSWRILRLLQRFRKDERGNALLMFTAVLVPLLLIVAVGIDFSQVLVVKRQLTGGVDAAALTLGTLPALTDAEADTKAENYVRAHYNEAIGTLKSVKATRSNDGIISVTAKAEIPMTFMRIAGYDKIDIEVSSQAFHKENKLEVVMVLDNSGSMGGTNMSDL
ncbi:MAG: pilus assembly protein, partial [Alphaproteobacteria bacterium]